MITKLLDGLEVFLNVGVMSLNSSDLEMPGGCTYISHQVHRAVCSQWAFLRRAPVAPVVEHRCNRSHTALN